jgi:hypothetical protein
LTFGVAGFVVVNPQSALAGSGGAFVGGLIGGHVLTNMARRSERRTEAAEYQAYSRPAPAPQPAPVAQPAPQPQSAARTPQQRLDTLDQLAAKGIITKQEYQKRRQAIVNGL